MEPQVSFLETCSALPLAENGAAPDWLMLFPAGTSNGVDGRGPFKLSRPEAVVAASMNDGRSLPFDYNHQTVFAALNGQGSPASGWIDKLEVREGAIWGHVDWTGPGRAAVASREYRYLSPAFKQDASGEVTHIVSAGLVNAPNLRELPAINAQLSALSSQKPGDPIPMDKTLQDRLAVAVGLPIGAPIETIVAHAETHKIQTGAPDPALYVPMAAFTDLQTQVGQLRDTAASAHATNLVDGAAKAGKLTPAMREWGLSYASQNAAGFETWLAAAPVIVAGGIDPAVAAAAEAGKVATGALTPSELAVCAQLGITTADYTASKQKAA
jgi:phage I-like protein